MGTEQGLAEGTALPPDPLSAHRSPPDRHGGGDHGTLARPRCPPRNAVAVPLHFSRWKCQEISVGGSTLSPVDRVVPPALAGRCDTLYRISFPTEATPPPSSLHRQHSIPGSPREVCPATEDNGGEGFLQSPATFRSLQKCVIVENPVFAKMRLDAVSTPAAQGDRTCSRPPASSKRRTTPAPPPALVPPPSCPVSTGSTGVLKPSADLQSPPPHELRCYRLPCDGTRWPAATAGPRRLSTSPASGPTSIDTTTPATPIFLPMMAASARMACDLLVERTRAVLDAARRVGRMGGRNRRPGRQGVEKRLAGGE